MPATPMKEAAERYSPEMAEAFQPTETERPATKKSPALLDLPAVQKPMPTVMTTVTSEQKAIQGSMPAAARRGGRSCHLVRPSWAAWASASSSAMERLMKT